MRCVRGAVLLGSSALFVVTGFGEVALAQVVLPQVVVSGAKPKAKPHPVRRRTAAPPAAVTPVNTADVKNDEFDNDAGCLQQDRLHRRVGAYGSGLRTGDANIGSEAPLPGEATCLSNTEA